jgi:hypothetical protein
MGLLKDAAWLDFKLGLTFLFGISAGGIALWAGTNTIGVGFGFLIGAVTGTVVGKGIWRALSE